MLSLAITGCVTANPAHETDPAAPAYVPDTAAISNMVWQAKATTGAAATIFPPAAAYKVPVDLGIDTAAAGLTAISLLVAWFKSRKQNKRLGTQLDAVTTVLEKATDAAALKARVQEIATVAGVEEDLNKRVSKL